MNLRDVIVALLEDAKLYLRQIDEGTYVAPIRLLSNSTVGQHTRHFIEFFQCLLQQYESGIIDYDKRIRDKRLETNPYFVVDTIDDIIKSLPTTESEMPLKLQSNYGVDKELCVYVATNLSRELVYNVEHTIHHLAIVKIALAIEAPSIQLPSHFGVAPSTIKFQKHTQHTTVSV
jgi:hypothetical protein